MANAALCYGAAPASEKAGSFAKDQFAIHFKGQLQGTSKNFEKTLRAAGHLMKLAAHTVEYRHRVLLGETVINFVFIAP